MAKKEEKLKTRPDLDDADYLAWLWAQPENRGIDVPGLYRKMLEWCGKKRITPTRLRLLKWLDTERSAVPMTMLPTREAMKEPETETKFVPEPPCDICGKEFCLQLHRKERGI